MDTAILIGITAGFFFWLCCGIFIGITGHSLKRTPPRVMTGAPLDACQMHVQCFGCKKDIYITFRKGDIKQFLVGSLNEYLCPSCEGTING